MRGFRLSLFLGVALVIGACGKQQSESQAPATTPATALAPPASTAAPAATATERQEVGLAPAPANKIAKLNEDGSESGGEATADTGTGNRLLAAVAATMAAATPSASAQANLAPPPLWQEGVNYSRLVPAQPTDVPPGQVEVLEFFWYACPHCYAIDPQVEAWKMSKPASITYTRVPVMWTVGHRATARLFYTLQSLGKLEQFHSAVFTEIHDHNNPLVGADPNDAAQAERIQTTFAVKLGIPEDKFKSAYHSFDVEKALQRADQLEQRYRIEGVPTFVVNGKYVADVRSAGGPDRLLNLVTDFAAQEHKH
jgi:protein dithiol oxidoreductase (disulfide-forming)